MAENESVSSSLIPLAMLATGAITSVDAVIDGEKESIILFRDGDQVAAWFNICPHAGRRLDYAPGQFLRSGGDLVCAAHGASFALPSGRCVAGPCRGASLRAVPVAVSDDGFIVLGSTG